MLRGDELREYVQDLSAGRKSWHIATRELAQIVLALVDEQQEDGKDIMSMQAEIGQLQGRLQGEQHTRAGILKRLRHLQSEWAKSR